MLHFINFQVKHQGKCFLCLFENIDQTSRLCITRNELFDSVTPSFDHYYNLFGLKNGNFQYNCDDPEIFDDDGKYENLPISKKPIIILEKFQKFWSKIYLPKMQKIYNQLFADNFIYYQFNDHVYSDYIDDLAIGVDNLRQIDSGAKNQWIQSYFDSILLNSTIERDASFENIFQRIRKQNEHGEVLYSAQHSILSGLNFKNHRVLDEILILSQPKFSDFVDIFRGPVYPLKIQMRGKTDIRMRLENFIIDQDPEIKDNENEEINYEIGEYYDDGGDDIEYDYSAGISNQRRTNVQKILDQYHEDFENFVILEVENDSFEYNSNYDWTNNLENLDGLERFLDSPGSEVLYSRNQLQEIQRVESAVYLERGTYVFIILMTWLVIFAILAIILCRIYFLIKRFIKQKMIPFLNKKWTNFKNFWKNLYLNFINSCFARFWFKIFDCLCLRCCKKGDHNYSYSFSDKEENLKTNSTARLLSTTDDEINLKPEIVIVTENSDLSHSSAHSFFNRIHHEVLPAIPKNDSSSIILEDSRGDQQIIVENPANIINKSIVQTNIPIYESKMAKVIPLKVSNSDFQSSELSSNELSAIKNNNLRSESMEIELAQSSTTNTMNCKKTLSTISEETKSQLVNFSEVNLRIGSRLAVNQDDSAELYGDILRGQRVSGTNQIDA